MLLEIKYSFSLSSGSQYGTFILTYDKYKFWHIELLGNGLYNGLKNPCSFSSAYKAISHAGEMIVSAYKRSGISHNSDWEIKGIDGLDKVLALTKEL